MFQIDVNKKKLKKTEHNKPKIKQTTTTLLENEKKRNDEKKNEKNLEKNPKNFWF